MKMNHRMAAAAAGLMVVVLALAAGPSPARAERVHFNPKYQPTKPFPKEIHYNDRVDLKNISRAPRRWDYVEPEDRDTRITMCWAYLGHQWVIKEIKEWFIHHVIPSDLTCSGIMHTHKDCFPDMFSIWPYVVTQNAFNLLKHCLVHHHYKGEATPGWHGPRQPSGKVLPVRRGKRGGKGGA